MKPHCILSAAILNVLAVCTAFAQTSFRLFNYDPPAVDAPVFDADGVPLAGTNFRAELWGSASPDSLQPAIVIETGEQEIAPFLDRGYFNHVPRVGNLCIPSVPPYGWAWLQVRAWDARLGSTYEEVAALGMGGYGESPLFYAQGHDPFRVPPDLPAPLIGLQSFSLRPVPEPSAWALLAMGGLLLGSTAWRRHRLRP